MRHQKKGRKFGRKTGPRRAFMKSLAVNLIERGRIETTEARAKALRPFVERLVTHGKKKNLAGLRLLTATLPKKTALKLWNETAPKYETRRGGYTRITKLALRRKNDGAPMARIEFI